MDKWVVRNFLARSAMPGYDPAGTEPVPVYKTASWLEKLWDSGIKSILCLIHQSEIEHFFPKIPYGLLKYYENWGFKTAHVPIEDGNDPPLSLPECRDIWAAYESLPKPVVVHCQAGRDRTGMAVKFIVKKLEQRASGKK